MLMFVKVINHRKNFFVGGQLLYTLYNSNLKFLVKIYDKMIVCRWCCSLSINFIINLCLIQFSASKLFKSLNNFATIFKILILLFFLLSYCTIFIGKKAIALNLVETFAPSADIVNWIKKAVTWNGYIDVLSCVS